MVFATARAQKGAQGSSNKRVALTLLDFRESMKIIKNFGLYGNLKHSEEFFTIQIISYYIRFYSSEEASYLHQSGVCKTN